MGVRIWHGVVCLVLSLGCTIADVFEPIQKLSPPTGKNGEPVYVNSSMYILDVRDVNAKNMEFTMTMYFRQNWRDERLKFKGTENKVISGISVEQIWKPDLFFVEENGGNLHTISTPNIFTRISPDGTVLYSMRLTMAFRCAMNLRYYPHDSQTCSFQVESYGYTADKVKLAWHEDQPHRAVGMASSIDLPNFYISSFEYDGEVITLSPNMNMYSRLVVKLNFDRKLGFYMTKIFIPYIILVMVAWCAFWIRPKFVAQRLCLLLSITFLMITLFMDLSSHIPPASYTKSIDVWASICISLVFTALLESIYVSTMARKTNKQCDMEDQAKILGGIELGNDEKKGKTRCFAIGGQLALRNILYAENRVDIQLRLLYPLFFGIFNLIYWCTYAA